MGNINLLPEDLRRREEKELNKSAKRPKIFDIQLSNPVSEKSIKERRPTRSWWSRLFGDQKKAPMPELSQPEKTPPITNKVDFLNSTEKPITEKKISFQKASKVQQKKYSWFNVLGPLRSPIKLEKTIVKPVKAPLPSLAKPAPQEVKIKISWWQRFSQRFKRAPRKLSPVGINTGNVKVVKKTVASFSPQSSDHHFIAPTTIKTFSTSPVVAPIKTVKPLSVVKEDIVKVSGWRAIFQSLFHRRQRARIITAVSKSPIPEKHTEKLKDKKPKPVEAEKESKRYHLVDKIEGKPKFLINLMPEELASQRQINYSGRMIATIVVIALAAIIVYGISWTFGYYQTKMDNNMALKSAEFAELEALWQQYDDLRQTNRIAADKIMALNNLFGQRVRWTNFFQLLSQYTLDSVYYTDLQIDKNGVFTLPAVATNYSEVAKQVALLRQHNDFVSEVKVSTIVLQSEAQKGITGVGFDLRLKLTDGVLKAK